MKPHPPHYREQAATLRARGWNYYQIAKALGVAPGTVQRWLDPQAHQRSLQVSRDYKRHHRGICPECGGPTWIGSKRCQDCQRQFQRNNKRWTDEAIIKAIQQWAAEHGHPPRVSDWLKAGQDHPSFGSCYGPQCSFKNWADAIEAAGFPRPYTGHKYYLTPSAPRTRKPLPDLRKRKREQRIADLRKALDADPDSQSP